MTPPTPRASYPMQSLSDIASSWGYEGHVAYPERQAAQRDEDLAQGTIDTRLFSSGLRWCHSDLRYAATHTREALLERSLTVFVVSQGAPLRWQHGHTTRHGRGEDTMAVCAVNQEATLAQSPVAGQAIRCLVIQAKPDQLQDAQLAEQLHHCLRHTRILPLPAAALHPLVAVQNPTAPYAGLVQAMHCESQALALLAQGLEALGQQDTHATSLSAPDRHRLHRLCQQLQAEPMEPYTLMQLARDAGFSLSALKDKFQRHTGQSVMEYLRTQRLQRARAGLLHEGWSVKQAAYLCGYRHPANFSTAFRRQFGRSPSDLIAH